MSESIQVPQASQPFINKADSIKIIKATGITVIIAGFIGVLCSAALYGSMF